MKRYFRSKLILAPIVCSSLLLLPSHTCAQRPKRNRPSASATKVRFDSGNSALRIPLEIDNNLILLQVSVNGTKPLRLIFDTGAGMTFISSQRAAELGLKSQGDVDANATGGKVQGSYTKGVSLSVQGAEVSNQLVAWMPLPTPPGFEFDGVIGFDFINSFVVELDYPNKMMNLYDPRNYVYSGKGEVIPLLLAGLKTPLVPTRIALKGRSVEAKLEVDTGSDDTFIINSPFVRKHNLTEAVQQTDQHTRNGAGGEQKVIVARVEAVQLGRITLKNPPLALSLDTEGAGASEENDGTIGGEIFRRFKVIIDYSRKRMILEPNKDFNDAYNIESGE
jgi:hypothetical protein